MGKVIAIDGPSGAGKSTVSRLVAERLGFRFLDTGALYRAVGLHLKRSKVKPESDDEEILGVLKDVKMSLTGARLSLNGEDVSEAIRTPEAGHCASVFSARKVVRDFLFHMQRDAASNDNIVAEGRDMTSVVFPNAWKKFYLDASEKVRAERRYCQLRSKGITVTTEEALADVRERDARDSERNIAPLQRVADAIYVDTSALSLEEVLDIMFREIDR